MQVKKNYKEGVTKMKEGGKINDVMLWTSQPNKFFKEYFVNMDIIFMEHLCHHYSNMQPNSLCISLDFE